MPNCFIKKVKMIIVNSIVTVCFCLSQTCLNAYNVGLFSIFCKRCYIHLCLFATMSVVFIILGLSCQCCRLWLIKRLNNQLDVWVIIPTFPYCCVCMLKLLNCWSMLLFICKWSYLMFAYSVHLRGATTCMNDFELRLLSEYYYSLYNAQSRDHCKYLYQPCKHGWLVYCTVLYD